MVGALCAVVYVAAVGAVTDHLFAVYLPSTEMKFFQPVVHVFLVFVVISAVLKLNHKLIKKDSIYSKRWHKATKVIAICLLGLLASPSLFLFTNTEDIIFSEGILITEAIGITDIPIAILLAFNIFVVCTLYLGRNIGWYSGVMLILVDTLILAGYMNMGGYLNVAGDMNIAEPPLNLLPILIFDVFLMTVLTLPGVMNYCEIPENVFSRPLRKFEHDFI